MDRFGIEAPITFFMAILMVVALYVGAGAAETEIKPVSFIFGDSLSDVGNNNHLPRSLAKSNYRWYGIDYGNGTPTGRYTNGRTICDIVGIFLFPFSRIQLVPPWNIGHLGGTHGLGVANIAAEKAGLPIPAAYLDPSTDENTVLKRGVNYASGGGGILNETGSLFVKLLILPLQMVFFFCSFRFLTY
jgi:hypothetical protein